jgi:hypothetical protein
LKKLDLAQTVGILANVGVIVGIGILVLEIQQNNALMAAEARFNRLAIQTESITLAVVHPDLAELQVRSSDGGELTPVEHHRLAGFWSRVFQNMQWTYLEAYDDIPLEGWRGTFRTNKFVQEFWKSRKRAYRPEFAQFIDENVVVVP